MWTQQRQSSQPALLKQPCRNATIGLGLYTLFVLGKQGNAIGRDKLSGFDQTSNELSQKILALEKSTHHHDAQEERIQDLQEELHCLRLKKASSDHLHSSSSVPAFVRIVESVFPGAAQIAILIMSHDRTMQCGQLLCCHPGNGAC